MTINKIGFDCSCGGKESDVQAKFSQEGKMVIQIKCIKCKHNHFLKDDDERCSSFFKES